MKSNMSNGYRSAASGLMASISARGGGASGRARNKARRPPLRGRPRAGRRSREAPGSRTDASGSEPPGSPAERRPHAPAWRDPKHARHAGMRRLAAEIAARRRGDATQQQRLPACLTKKPDNEFCPILNRRSAFRVLSRTRLSRPFFQLGRDGFRSFHHRCDRRFWTCPS